MALSQAITHLRPMDHEVRGTIVQLLEQNRFTKNYGPKRIMSELCTRRRHGRSIIFIFIFFLLYSCRYMTSNVILGRKGMGTWHVETPDA
jgi:hypothetical protein